MSVLGHIAIGVVAARRVTAPDGLSASETRRERLGRRMAALGVLALLPDSDFLLHAMAPGIPMLEHRGATHSLAVAVAIGVAAAFVLRASQVDRALLWGLLVAGVVASHGLMDAFGDTTLGVELFWPFSTIRVLAPWQLLPDPSLTPPLIRNFLGTLLVETLLFVPAWIYAFFPRSPGVGGSPRARP